MPSLPQSSPISVLVSVDPAPYDVSSPRPVPVGSKRCLELQPPGSKDASRESLAHTESFLCRGPSNISSKTQLTGLEAVQALSFREQMGGAGAKGHSMVPSNVDSCGRESQVNLNQQRQLWNPFRRKAAHLFESQKFDIVMGAIILFNVALMVLEVDASAECADEYSLCTPRWVLIVNHVLLGIYTAELIGRLCTFRLAFFKNRWNLIDAAILFVACIEVVVSTAVEVPGMQLVRIIRLGRLVRLLRVLKVFPMLYAMVRGFASTMSTIIWGFCVILALLLVWSILTVELVHPRNKMLYAEKGGDTSEWCYAAFSSVGNSITYYFQTLVAGDSWGACSIPLMQEYYETFWIFSMACITVQLGFTNLMLAVIVDAAAKVRDEDLHQRMIEKRKQEKEATEKLLTIIQRIDVDGSQTISWEELRASFEVDSEVQDLMAMLDIDEKDLRRMFNFMDTNKDGSVEYSEFVEAISKAGEQDTRVQLMMLKLHMSEVSRTCEKVLETISGASSGKLCGHGFKPRSPSKTLPGVREPAAAGEGRKQGSLDVGNGSKEVATALEQELNLLGANLEKRLEALAQEAAEQVSALARQTRSLSAVPGSTGERSAPSIMRRSEWSKASSATVLTSRPNVKITEESPASSPRPHRSRSARSLPSSGLSSSPGEVAAEGLPAVPAGEVLGRPAGAPGKQPKL